MRATRVAAALVAAVALTSPAPARAAEPDGACEYAHADNSQYAIRVFAVVVEGHAPATPEPPLSVTVTCTFTGPGGSASVSAWAVGPAAAAADVVVLDAGTYQVCWVFEVRWIYHWETYERCRTA